MVIEDSTTNRKLFGEIKSDRLSKVAVWKLNNKNVDRNKSSGGIYHLERRTNTGHGQRYASREPIAYSIFTMVERLQNSAITQCQKKT